jgi:hypothetical protein
MKNYEMGRRICFSFCVLSLLFLVGCHDDDGVGMSIQPDEDVLHTYSNMVNVETSSVVTDSVLSKYDYFLLGRYRDEKFGESAAEFMTQLDARIGGVTVPDTVVATSSSSSVGILNTLLTSIDSHYGDIISISQPSDVEVDSVRFYLQYTDDFFGDSAALQAISIYELNKPLKDTKTFTNVDVSDYCDKSLLLGKKSYQIQNKRSLTITLDNSLGERLLDVYKEGSSISSQNDFNEYFKGVYVSHTFNQGTVMQISVAGIQIFYHYDALIATTYDGADTTVRASSLGKELNPLVSSIFLSANKSVKRVNVVTQADLSTAVNTLNEGDYTFTYTPAGLYTSVDIPFDVLKDSIETISGEKDASRIMFNSAKLIFHRASLNWKTDIKASSFLLLISKSKVIDFFYNNTQPDGLTSFVTSIDTTYNTYTFNITAPLQNKYRGTGTTFEDDMVLVPVVRSSESSNYYYRQQLWLTATMLHSQNSFSEALRPRLDVVYTKR